MIFFGIISTPHFINFFVTFKFTKYCVICNRVYWCRKGLNCLRDKLGRKYLKLDLRKAFDGITILRRNKHFYIFSFEFKLYLAGWRVIKDQYYQLWRGTFEIQKVFNYDCHGLFLYNIFKSRYGLISIKIDAWGRRGGVCLPPPTLKFINIMQSNIIVETTCSCQYINTCY